MVRKLVAIALGAIALVALAAAPAFAEGYNDGNWNFTTGSDVSTYAGNAGLYVRTATGAGQIASFSGPHGGYTTTTNKCQDCHSTHYATGKYMLLRANSREEACDFCHVGGGGSQHNIQMDNAYDMTGVDVTGTAAGGNGTGHTLGYKGNAPADINPAFSDPNGFACFDCHTPHGNSARVLATFADPGRKMGGFIVQNVFKVGDPQGTVFAAGPVDIRTAANGADGTYWGVTTDEGNVIVVTRTGGVNTPAKKPIWPGGRFLLLKNPDGANDMSEVPTGTVADNGQVKMAISWDDPIGPADTAYGGDDRSHSANPAWNNSATPNKFDPLGLNSVSEFCTDCHAGAAGLSNQPANVWRPNPSDLATGSYVVAQSHDAQPRH